MLHFLDFVLTLLHLIIIAFNLFGWIFPGTRKANFVCLILTAFCWFILGIWFGWGYCPITDWQWRVKEQLGETNLPASFIRYYANKITGRNFDDSIVSIITLVCFVAAILTSVYFNFFLKRKK